MIKHPLSNGDAYSVLSLGFEIKDVGEMRKSFSAAMLHSAIHYSSVCHVKVEGLDGAEDEKWKCSKDALDMVLYTSVNCSRSH